MARAIYIGQIVIDPSVMHKMSHRAGGGCVEAEVLEAFLHRSDVELEERDDGSVAGFGTTANGRRLFAAFHPRNAADGLWALKSAWPV